MRIAIVYHSFHHGNTRRIAEALAVPLQAELYTVSQATQLDPRQFDLVGLGSGIYFGRHHRELRDLVANWPNVPSRSFVFSTAGISSLWNWWHASLVRLLTRRGCHVIAHFNCPGFDTYGLLWFIGGIHRTRPDQSDLTHATDFAKGLLFNLISAAPPHPKPPSAHT